MKLAGVITHQRRQMFAEREETISFSDRVTAVSLDYTFQLSNGFNLNVFHKYKKKNVHTFHFMKLQMIWSAENYFFLINYKAEEKMC